MNINQQGDINMEEVDACKISMQRILEQYKKRGSRILQNEVESYNNAFLVYLKQHGYTEETENFFLEGCSYLATNDYRAIHKYNNKQENKAEIFEKILQGERYRSNIANDSQKKVKFILTMLGYYLACRSNETQVINVLAIALANSCFTTDNKINAYLSKYALDAFIRPILKSENDLPNLKDIIEQPGFYNKFLQLMQAVFAACNIQENPRLSYIRSSLLGEMLAGNVVVDKSDQADVPDQAEEMEEDKTQEGKPEQPPEIFAPSKDTTGLVEKLQNDIEKIKYGHKKYEEKINQDLEETRKKIVFLQSAYDKQSADYNGLKKSYSQLNGEKVRLLGENKNLLQQIEKLQNTNQELNDRLSISHTALDKLDENAEYQQQAALNRIAQRLNLYYGDYIEALDEEMTIDLGINMLETLGDVFGILQKNGINVGNKG